MAGTLVLTTLSDGTNSTSATNAIQGSAKAWVNFNGTAGSVAIRSAYNVSSITQYTTGYYRVNFTNALSDSNYSAVITSGQDQVTWGMPMFAGANGTYGTAAFTTTGFGLTTNVPATDANIDNNLVCAVVFSL